ncbi:MAG: YfbM family protein [Chitinophagaceae bacterium]
MIGNLLRVTTSELESYLANSVLLEERIYNDASYEQDPNLVDIDKSWDGILFLLTGSSLEDTDHPLASVLFSNEIIDENQDLGYGPASYVTAAQVRELHEKISKITMEELRENYHPEKMNDVYPSIWGEQEELDYLIEYFKIVQQTYAQASANGEAIITFIN